MKCPSCKSMKTFVVDTRWIESQNQTRRRYECRDCGNRCTSYESIKSNPVKGRKPERRRPKKRIDIIKERHKLVKRKDT